MCPAGRPAGVTASGSSLGRPAVAIGGGEEGGAEGPGLRQPPRLERRRKVFHQPLDEGGGRTRLLPRRDQHTGVVAQVRVRRGKRGSGAAHVDRL